MQEPSEHVIIGQNVKMHDSAVIGCQPDHKDSWYSGYTGRLIIGDNVHIGPNVVIQLGYYGDTVIKDNAYILAGSYIGHDCMIAEHARIHANCTLGGNVYVGRHSYLGMNVTVNPGISIGDCCCVGSGSVVTKSIRYHMKAVGVPAKVIKRNELP
jgi:acetyltransferase-like isoleucine patch superfamily enzyme